MSTLQELSIQVRDRQTDSGYFRFRTEWMHVLSIFICLLVIYLATMPRTVVFEDDAFFIMAAYFNGIAHPPGYPLYTLLGHISTMFPIGSVAYRVHALSGLCGALSCACLYYLTKLLLTDRIYAYAAALGFGVSRIFWSQSIIAEVYSLNVLIFLILVILSIYIIRESNGKRVETQMKWMGFIYGLGLCNHWPLLIISTPMLLAIMLPQWKVWLKYIPQAILYLLAGLTPYVWMVWQSQMDPEISFYGPIESISEFWYYVSRQGYVEADQNIGAGLKDKFMFCGFLLKETILQFGYPQSILVFIGVFSQFRYLDKYICASLIWGYLGSTFVLNGLLGFNYDPLHQNIFRVYPVISYAVMSLWMVMGLKYVVARMSGIKIISLDKRFLNHVLCVLVILSEAFINLPYNYRAGDRLAYEYGMAILETLAQNSILITYADLDTGPAGYLNKVLKVRPDITLINSDGLVFSNRLYKPMAQLDKKHEILSDFIRSQSRPIYFTTGIPKIYGTNDYGIYTKVDKTLEINEAKSVINPRLEKFYESLLHIGNLTDPWEVMIKNLIISDYCRVATYFYIKKNEIYDLARLEDICRGFHAKKHMVEIFLSSPDPDLSFLRQHLDNAKSLMHEALIVEDIAELEYLYGRIALKENNTKQALAYFQNSLKIWPSEKNESILQIEQISRQPGK